MRLEFSFDDGCQEDIRIAELLDQYGFTATFYIPVGVTTLNPTQIRMLSENHTIGSHTMTHPLDMKRLNHPELRYELEASKEQLEDLIGQPVVDFCYPRGRHNEIVRQAVVDAGYTQARTTRVLYTTIPEDPFRTDTTIHFVDTRKEYEEMGLNYLIGKYLSRAKRDPRGYFHMWGHGWEIEKYDLWNQFETSLKFIKSFGIYRA